METVRDFIFLGSKITVDGNCSHEIKRHVLLEKKAMTNLGSILKIRDITLLTVKSSMVCFKKKKKSLKNHTSTKKDPEHFSCQVTPLLFHS